MATSWTLQWATLAGLVMYLVVMGVRRWLPESGHRRLRRYVRLFFFASLGMLLVKEIGWSRYWVPSTSMAPNLVVGDVLLVNRHAYTIRDPVVSRLAWVHTLPQRRDIVVFEAPHEPGTMFIKRVIGLPGDTVATFDKRWYINGELMPQTEAGLVADRRAGEVWNHPQWEEAGHLITFAPPTPGGVPDLMSWVVPPGHLFVLGDNRDRSEDSRAWGMLPVERLVGQAEKVLWNITSKDEPSESLLNPGKLAKAGQAR